MSKVRSSPSSTSNNTLEFEPLAGGEIWTRPVAYPNHSTVGFIDPDGRFQLKMDIRGRYEDGALVGEHQVLIFKNDPNSPGGARAPDLLTPARYAQFSTSPLRLTVDRDPTRNRYEFRLEKKGEGTLLRLTESGFDKVPPDRRDEAFRMNSNGWTQQMKNIQDYVLASRT